MGNLMDVLPEATLLPVDDEDTNQDAVDALDLCIICGHFPCDCDDQYDAWKDRQLD